MIKRFSSILLILTGCSSYFNSSNEAEHQMAYEELKTEIAEVRHALHATEVELRLLEEKLDTPQIDIYEEEIKTLFHKLAALEKSQERVFSDIRSLSTHANQTTTALSQYKELMQGARPPQSKKMKYTVKPGDTLEKIARKHQVTVSDLKTANRFDDDKIFVGQDVHIPTYE
jgi:LysM repeat protein